jgi:hypothetical protein
MEFDLPEDLSTLSDQQVSDLLREAQAEERKVSDRRKNVQDRLDFTRGGSGSPDLVDKLAADEARISAERRRLHQLLDLLSAERIRRR